MAFASRLHTPNTSGHSAEKLWNSSSGRPVLQCLSGHHQIEWSYESNARHGLRFASLGAVRLAPSCETLHPVVLALRHLSRHHWIEKKKEIFSVERYDTFAARRRQLKIFAG